MDDTRFRSDRGGDQPYPTEEEYQDSDVPNYAAEEHYQDNEVPRARRHGPAVQSRSVRESGKLIPHSGRHYGPDTSWQRHDHARRPSCDTAIEGSAQRACGTVWAEPQDSRQVAQTGLRQRRSHGAESSALDSPVARGRGYRRRLPQAYAAAARRLPLCPAGDHSEPDPVVPASMPQASRHQPVAGDRRRQDLQEAFQTLPNRLLSHRHRRGSYRGG